MEVRHRGGAEGQRGGRRGPEGRSAPLYRVGWSTVLIWIFIDSVFPKMPFHMYNDSKLLKCGWGQVAVIMTCSVMCLCFEKLALLGKSLAHI